MKNGQQNINMDSTNSTNTAEAPSLVHNHSYSKFSNPAVARVCKYDYESASMNQNIKSASFLGLISKSAFLVLLTILSGVLAFYLVMNSINSVSSTLLIVFMVAFPIIGSIAAVVSVFSQKAACVCGPIYAICFGSFIGIISGFLDIAIGGIVLIALLATVCIFFVMLMLYAIKAIRVSNKFVKFIACFGIGLIFTHLIMFIITLIYPPVYLIIYGSPLGIIISVIMCIYGAMMLLVDFDNMNMAVSSGAPKSIEWSLATSLLTTLVYMYIQILRLLLVIVANRK